MMDITLDVHLEGSGKKVQTLYKKSEVETSQVSLKDEDRIYFQLVLPNDNYVVTLHITDISLAPSGRAIPVAGGYAYRWRALGTEGGNNPFFRNILGECRLALSIAPDSVSPAEYIPLSPVDIRGNKLSQENAQKMISYIGRHAPEAIWLPRSATLFPTARNGENRHDYMSFFDEAERGVEVLRSAFPYIRNNACSRLTPKNRIQKTDLRPDYSASNFDWLASHPDVLIPVQEQSFDSIYIASQSYIPEELEIQQLDEEYDVYENRIIVGYIDLVCEYLSLFINKFGENTNTSEIDSYKRGRGLYLFEILKKEGLKFLATSVSRARRMLESLRELYNSYNSVFNVSYSLKNPPIFTPKVLSNLYYRSIFECAASWHALGSPDWTMAEPQAGIKSIDQVYEIYCLHRIREGIIEAGYSQIEPEDEQKEIMTFVNETHSVELHYERFFFSSRYKKDADFHNIENWYGDGYKLIQRKGSWRSHRRPDFSLLIADKSNNENKQLVIFDAKYKDHHSTFANDLPDATLKYVHGIARPEGGPAPTVVLYLLCSGNESKDRSNCQYHAAEVGFDIYSRTPSLPCLGVVEVSPRELWDFKVFIKRVLEVAIEASKNSNKRRYTPDIP